MAYFVTVWYSDRKFLKHVIKTEKQFFLKFLSQRISNEEWKGTVGKRKKCWKLPIMIKKDVCLILIHCAPNSHTPRATNEYKSCGFFGCLRKASNSISSHHFRMRWAKDHKPLHRLHRSVHKKIHSTAVKTIVFHRTGNGAI